MTTPPQLSPDLRPLRYCPNCGQRVAQRSERCFMCGQDLQVGRRRFSLPVGELLLVAVIVGVSYLWWTREPEPLGAGITSRFSGTPTATASAIPPTPTASATPLPTETATATPSPTPILYTVVRGDTVERIAAAYGVGVEDLMISNGLTSDLIQVDQTLVIPVAPVARGPDGRPLPTATPTPVSAIYLVVVRAGDTLENIAQRLGSSVDAVVRANEALENADSVIQPGDQLVVPVGTIVPTPTPDGRQPPTATPVPTPTPTPGTRWPAPRLLSPAEGAEIVGSSLLLQWLSLGTLDTGEVYVVRVVPEGRPGDQLTAVTAGTSFRVPSDWLAQQLRRTQRFSWSVQVARDTRTVAGQATGLLATSPSSLARVFWVGGEGE